MRRVDLTGRKFFRWTVLSYAGFDKAAKWLCRCECGAEKTVAYQNLVTGKSKSCGCYRAEIAPSLVPVRDNTGLNNPKARKQVAKFGELYIPSSDVWYKRAAGVFHNAKRRGIPIGFDSAQELAIYVKSIVPALCPVFQHPFEERGSGFSKWSPSIDKIDPTLGYVRGNIQVISMLANCMKRDANPEELRVFAKWVLDKDEK